VPFGLVKSQSHGATVARTFSHLVIGAAAWDRGRSMKLGVPAPEVNPITRDLPATTSLTRREITVTNQTSYRCQQKVGVNLGAFGKSLPNQVVGLPESSRSLLDEHRC
jgi:hypothetical protein